MHETVDAKVAELAAAIKPRLRGVLHEAAFAISLITGTALVCLSDGARARTAATVYAVSVALLFGTSAAYHRGPWTGRSKALMKRLDHSSIFLLIAGTATPLALLALPDQQGRQLIGAGALQPAAIAGVKARAWLRGGGVGIVEQRETGLHGRFNGGRQHHGFLFT